MVLLSSNLQSLSLLNLNFFKILLWLHFIILIPLYVVHSHALDFLQFLICGDLCVTQVTIYLPSLD